MPFARDILNRLKWADHALDSAEITYIHRGAPGDVAVIRGIEITDVGRSFFSTADATIPYHRIQSIACDGEVLFSRESGSP